ncbi:MAG TPA: YihY/virulence factor BrkB family protein [Rudaea sp.]
MTRASFPRRLWKAALHLWEQDPWTLAASIAFYSALSFAPMIAIGAWLSSLFAPGSQDRIVDELGLLLGPQVRAVARSVVENASPALFGHGFAAALTVGALIVSATTAFAQLQYAINRIWSVRAQAIGAVREWIRRRLLSFGMIAVIGFLLLVTLVVNAVIAAFLARRDAIGVIVNELIALAVFGVAFAGMFRFVPDRAPPLRAAILGGLVTGVLFDIGKWALAAFLASATTADAYGASGSIILLLMWVYYSSVVVLVGAAFTSSLLDIGDNAEHGTT